MMSFSRCWGGVIILSPSTGRHQAIVYSIIDFWSFHFISILLSIICYIIYNILYFCPLIYFIFLTVTSLSLYIIKRSRRYRRVQEWREDRVGRGKVEGDRKIGGEVGGRWGCDGMSGGTREERGGVDLCKNHATKLLSILRYYKGK